MEQSTKKPKEEMVNVNSGHQKSGPRSGCKNSRNLGSEMGYLVFHSKTKKLGFFPLA